MGTGRTIFKGVHLQNPASEPIGCLIPFTFTEIQLKKTGARDLEKPRSGFAKFSLTTFRLLHIYIRCKRTPLHHPPSAHDYRIFLVTPINWQILKLPSHTDVSYSIVNNIDYEQLSGYTLLVHDVEFTPRWCWQSPGWPRTRTAGTGSPHLRRTCSGTRPWGPKVILKICWPTVFY